MLIDFHTHAFPPKIASRAVASLSHGSGGMIPRTDGTADSLLSEMQRDGVDLSVVLSIATNPRQQHNVNDYAMEMNRSSRIAAFGSVHPDAPDALDELERIADAGLKGVKFHPEYQCFFADEDRMKPIYRKISQLGLITVFHAGQDIGFAPPYHCMPEHLTGALKWLDVPVIAAHWGGYGIGPEVIDRLCGENLYFDTSMGYGCIPRPIAQAIIDKHGPEKILFGSDMPWHRPEWELRLLETLDISREDREKICFRNALKLLKL
ncbi:MAG: amidohydrolase [Oscillospiraceae bacterium]|nr:amidohydrolase [Oscillospiraceae bacterium]